MPIPRPPFIDDLALNELRALEAPELLPSACWSTNGDVNVNDSRPLPPPMPAARPGPMMRLPVLNMLGTMPRSEPRRLPEGDAPTTSTLMLTPLASGSTV